MINHYHFKNQGFPSTANGKSNFQTLKNVQNLRKMTPLDIRRLATGLTDIIKHENEDVQVQRQEVKVI